METGHFLLPGTSLILTTDHFSVHYFLFLRVCSKSDMSFFPISKMNIDFDCRWFSGKALEMSVGQVWFFTWRSKDVPHTFTLPHCICYQQRAAQICFRTANRSLLFSFCPTFHVKLLTIKSYSISCVVLQYISYSTMRDEMVH